MTSRSAYWLIGRRSGPGVTTRGVDVGDGVLDGVGLGVTGVLVGIGNGVSVGGEGVTNTCRVAVGGVVSGAGVQVAGNPLSKTSSTWPIVCLNSSAALAVGTNVGKYARVDWQPLNTKMRMIRPIKRRIDRYRSNVKRRRGDISIIVPRANL
jgi:hypothetical protein